MALYNYYDPSANGGGGYYYNAATKAATSQKGAQAGAQPGIQPATTTPSWAQVPTATPTATAYNNADQAVAYDWGSGWPELQLQQAALGISSDQFDQQMALERQTAQWQQDYQQAALDLQRQTADQSTQQYYASLGLNYLELLSSMRGPSNWVQYANTQRAASQSEVPAFLTALKNNLSLAGYQAPSSDADSSQSSAEQWAQALLNGTATTADYSGLTAPLPQQISSTQWANMAPSEKSMLESLVEAGGGYWEDYVQQMQAAWPTRSVNASMTWL